MAFKVDTLLAGFSLLQDQLRKTAEKHDDVAKGYHATVAELAEKQKVARESAAAALKEAERARKIADKITAFLA